METFPTEDHFTRLLFRLPPEIRNAIYELCFPNPRTHLKVQDRVPEMRWLACSPRVFAEPATLVYSSTCFYHAVTLASSAWPTSPVRSLVKIFDHHVRKTYAGRDDDDDDRFRWIRPLAGSMVQEIVLDLRVDYDHVAALPRWLRRFWEDWTTVFTRVKRVLVFFGPDFMLCDFGLVQRREGGDGSKHTWIDARKSVYGEKLRETVETLRELCPDDCQVRWKISMLFNFFDTSTKKSPRGVKRKYGGKGKAVLRTDAGTSERLPLPGVS